MEAEAHLIIQSGEMRLHIKTPKEVADKYHQIVKEYPEMDQLEALLETKKLLPFEEN